MPDVPRYLTNCNNTSSGHPISTVHRQATSSEINSADIALSDPLSTCRLINDVMFSSDWFSNDHRRFNFTDMNFCRSQASVVYVYCTFLDEEQMSMLTAKCEELALGTVIVTVTKPIFSPSIVRVLAIPAKMNFGETTAYIMRRLEPEYE